MSSGKKNDPFAGSLRVRSCAIIVQDQKLLLVKQNAPTRPEPIWLPPGGGVQTGETAENAAVRELKEELNIEIATEKLLFIHEFIEAPYHAIELYFKAVLVSGEIRIGNDPELSAGHQQLIGYDFIPLNKLNKLLVYPEFIRNSTVDMFRADSGISYHKSTNKIG